MCGTNWLASNELWQWLSQCNHHKRCHLYYYYYYYSFIHSFMSGMHHYECIAPNIDINLQSGQFWATSAALFIDFRSCWVVFIHVVQGRPGGLLQFSQGEAVKICLTSDSSGIRAMWVNRDRRHAWTVAKRWGCSVFRLASSFCTLLSLFKHAESVTLCIKTSGNFSQHQASLT